MLTWQGLQCESCAGSGTVLEVGRASVTDATITFAVLFAAVALFIWNRLPVEIVAIGAAFCLYATGVVDLRQGHERALGRGAVPALLGGTPNTYPSRYVAASPAELLPLGVRQVLLHGTADPIVPVETSRSYRTSAVAKGDRAELIELERAGHFELVAPETPQGKKVVEAVVSLL